MVSADLAAAGLQAGKHGGADGRDPCHHGAVRAGGSATTIVTVWLRSRCRERQSRDQSSRKTAQALPPGSRIVDLGRRGVIIDVGTRTVGE